MYVSFDQKMVYLANPATASKSTARALLGAGFEKVGYDHHSGLYSEGSPVRKENRDEWYVFTSVRNHWDTAVCWVFRKYITGPVPGEPDVWTTDVLARVLNEQVPRRASGPRRFDRVNPWIGDSTLWHLHTDIDHCIRLEGGIAIDNTMRINDELKALLGSSAPQLPRERINESKARRRRHYSVFYTQPMVDYIAERFADEIEKFGFVF